MSRTKKITFTLLLLVAAGTAAWALADSKPVNFLFEAGWEPDAKLPGGGVIVNRGEGANGVITVDLPMPPPAESVEPPIELGADEVTYMDITVTDENGVERRYKTEQKEAVNYSIELEYRWDNDVVQKYLVKHTVPQQ